MVYACTICTKTPKHVVYEGYVRVKTGIVIALDPSYTFSPVLIWIRGFIRISFLVLICWHSEQYNTFQLLILPVGPVFQINLHEKCELIYKKSDRINSDRQSGSDQLGSTRIASDHKKKKQTNKT